MKKGYPSEQTANLQSTENDYESELRKTSYEITKKEEVDPRENKEVNKRSENNEDQNKSSDQIPQNKEDQNKTSEDNEDHILYRPLLKAIQGNDWKSVEDFVTNNRKVLTATINIYERDTFFHMIARNINTPISLIKKLLEKVTPKSLGELKDCKGESVVFDAARYGNKKTVEVFVRKNGNLPEQKSTAGELPIEAAAYCGNKETTEYLLSVTTTRLDDNSTLYVLCSLISSGIYGLALALLNRYSGNIVLDSVSRGYVLDMLARRPLEFESGNRMGYWKLLIYKLIPIQEEQIPLSRGVDGDNQRSQELIVEQRIPLPKTVEGDMENPSDQRSQEFEKSTPLPFLQKISIDFGNIHQKLYIIFWKVLIHLAPGIKRIHDTKLVHKQTLKIVRMMCHNRIIWSTKEARSLAIPFLTAARLGIYEIVQEISEAYFYSFKFVDKDKRGIFELAVLHRHEKLFSFIKTTNFAQFYLTGATSHFTVSNILHLVAKYVPSSKISGAALQMQRELQWFKAVESYVHPSFQEQQDENGRTPRQVFSKEHEQLLKNGEKWMKDTASSCTLVATLIITVVFTAAFTIPGGNNAAGIPMFLYQPSFLVFVVSDSLALFSSTTSLLFFLGILTSRYEEDDFLESSFPKTLIFGFITLFFSIVTMMVAFGATIYIYLCHPWKFAITPISLLGFVPVALFLWLQSPLLLEIWSSIFRPTILQPGTRKKPR